MRETGAPYAEALGVAAMLMAVGYALYDTEMAADVLGSPLTELLKSHIF